MGGALLLLQQARRPRGVAGPAELAPYAARDDEARRDADAVHRLRHHSAV